MRTKVLLLVLVLALPALHVSADDDQNTNRGFNPHGMYAFGEIDNVNLFNGNLIVNIPLSPQSYPLNGGFSYGVHLVYTGNPWDFVPDPNPPVGSPRIKDPLPNRRSNAGLGWRVSMGRMRIPGGDLSGSFGYSYESPDGSKHPFFETLHPNDPVDSNTSYTRDGTYLRLTLTNNRLDMAFPDGMIHSFDPATGFLTSIRTPFDSATAPSVTITYHTTDPASCPAGTAADSCWEINDMTGGSPSRKHWVTFRTDSNVHDGARADKIILAGVGGHSLTYQLNYLGPNDTQLATDTLNTCYVFGPSTPSSFYVPILSSITLPDGTAYSFDYYLNEPNVCSQGSLKTLTLPTLGTIAYTYQNYMAAIGADDAPSLPGVHTRIRGEQMQNGQIVNPQTWTYTVTAADQGVYPTTDHDRKLDDYEIVYGNIPPSTRDCATNESEFRELTVTVSRPDGISEKNYFSLARRDGRYYCFGSNTESWLGMEYGLPITHRSGTLTSFMPISGVQRYLSTQTYDGLGLPLRSSYATYERDGGAYTGAAYDDRRVVGSTTRFDDDDGRYIDMANSNFDGVGHYRQSVIADSGLGGLKRTTFTNYNGALGTYSYANPSGYTMIGNGQPWILGTFDYQQVSEGTAIARSDACFSNGALTRSRDRASSSGSPGTSDVVHAYQIDGSGNRTSELTYGGDTQPVGTSSDLCSMSLPGTPAYEVHHTYSYGVQNGSDYFNFGTAYLNVLNLGVDATGIVTSETDPSGIQTQYSYDSFSRLIGVSRPGVTTKSYTYTPPASSPAFSGAKVTETQGDLTNSYTYDALGRLATESRTMPDGSAATRTTTYDAFDRKIKAYDWTSSGIGPETDFAFDAFGRVIGITTPDAKSTQYIYAGTTTTPQHVGGGVSSMTRRSEIATSLTGAQTIDATETYDSAGRLTSVVQKSGPTTSLSTTGADVTATYTYDLANRLAGVKMGAATGAVQNRIFDYDNRGFLRWESQPESGVTSYTYDAAGHVKSRLQSGANSIFDLTYTYDAAGRPLSVSGRDPLNATTFRAIKDFVYSGANTTLGGATDYSKGKLISATRHNYGDANVTVYSPFGREPEYDVQDNYNYFDLAGRRTTRTTLLSMVTPAGTTLLKQFTTSMTYDTLGLAQTITYPVCFACGAPSSDPDRRFVTRTYARGRLQSLVDYDGGGQTLGYVSGISYWPNGMRNTITHWGAGGRSIADVQTVTNMPRPASLQFGAMNTQPYDRCVRPTFSIQPVSTPLTNGSATLTAMATGTLPMTYDWYTLGGQLVGGSSSLPVTAAGDYYAIARNACGYEQSETAHVSTDCQLPSTGQIAAVLQPDGSWILKPNPVARQQNRTFCWSLAPSQTCLANGTSETFAIGVQSATTTYRLTISDVCGSSSGDVTITVPLATTNGMSATWMSTSGYVQVTWLPIGGATAYSVERRHDGGGWEALACTATPCNDAGVVAGKTYVYRVTSDNGGHTNYDLATTTTFTAAVSGQPVGVTPFNEMLRAANLVRAAAGWPALDWSNILSSSDPLPSPGSAITARQVVACRARINEALQAVGVVAGDYTTPDLLNVAVSAAAVNEVQQRAQ